MASDQDLAKAEAIKRFRSAVRLELSIAGDWIIGRHLDELRAAADRQIASGGVPALERGLGTAAKKIADALSPMIEREIAKHLALELKPVE